MRQSAASEASPSLHDNLSTPKSGHDQMCLHAHEQELSESLNKELHNLLHR